MNVAKNLYIVGAGFSFNAGLPLASGFTEALLAPRIPLKKGEANDILNRTIRQFVDDVFGDGHQVDPREWPPLEDIFTIIDLAANAGHNLGIRYPASALRTIRRALIVRFMRMLRIEYNQKQKDPDTRSKKLAELIACLDIESTAFLSLNWDTVLEAGLAKVQRVERFDYGCDAISAGFVQSGAVKMKAERRLGGPTARILKPHGSINWMYCDCCSRLFWFGPSNTAKIASRLFKPSDRAFVKEMIGATPRRITTEAHCPGCDAEALGTRFATFSYRKALDFPMHLATWREAERQLRYAHNWIFIGYSMPPADYEFKSLLKRVQLSRQRQPNVVVITSGGRNSATKSTFRAFFGKETIPPKNMHTNELDSEALTALRAIGALKPSSSMSNKTRASGARRKSKLSS